VVRSQVRGAAIVGGFIVVPASTARTLTGGQSDAGGGLEGICVARDFSLRYKRRAG